MHMLLNQALYKFEDLHDDNIFKQHYEAMFMQIEEMLNNLTENLDVVESENYSYIQKKLSNTVSRIKLKENNLC
jgi:arginyl-tRNA synthetase